MSSPVQAFRPSGTRASAVRGAPAHAPVAPVLTDAAAPALAHADGTLLRSGARHRILAGSMHYFRVHPAQWRDRLERLAELGVNTLDTYIAWNFHERVEGAPRFDGWRDIERYITLAAEIGLDVIVRPGPFICAEWDNGGFPAWLTAREGMRVRSTDPAFVDAVERWFDALMPRLVPLQAGHGGPIVAVQVENEFGSFGADPAYLAAMRDALTSRGITELLYTADGPTERMQEGGSIPGVMATATFGSKPDEAERLLRSRRADEPFMCAEFWNGWFDHWGERHNVRSASDAASDIADILSLDGSVSVYMAHGGTNFGLWAGANHDGTALQPTVTSYDSDAPIAENGELTAKFFAIRDVFWPDADADAIPFDRSPASLAPRVLPASAGADLLDGLAGARRAATASVPLSFEQLGLAAGMVLYRASVPVSAGPARLSVSGLHDRAIVFVDGVRAGVLETPLAELTIEGAGRAMRLELLVENMGRINYGPLIGQGKGILGEVRVADAVVTDWQCVPLALDEWSQEQLAGCVSSAAPSRPGVAGFATATLELSEPADAFLALPGSGKGFVWIGDFLLGRYWNIGPQQTLYVPAPLLRAGSNTITVLELEHRGESVELRPHADLGQRAEYIETF